LERIGGEKKMMAKTNHWGALAAAAGTLVAVGLLVLMMLVVDARPAGATFPGKPGNIAYEGFDGTDREIYTINPGGGGKVKVTDNTTNDSDPNYSPSGKKIAYSGYDGQDYEIYTINVGGGGKVQLTDNTTGDYTPSYSPNGQKIAYRSYDGQDDEIYTINAGGGSRFNVTDNGTNDYEPSWGSK
jgi:Tol biopolymer transport system component